MSTTFPDRDEPGGVVMLLVGLTTPEGLVDEPGVTGRYLRSYNPNGHGGRGHIATTSRRAWARRFPSVGWALTCWRQQSTTHPLRIDGKPNKPLTAYSVEIVAAEEPP